MRKILLILSLAIFAVCFIFPCFVLPFGEYKGKMDIGEDKKVEYVIKFQLNGKAKAKFGENDWVENYYKVKDGKVIISEDKTFNDEDVYFTLANVNSISYPILGKMTNSVGVIASVAILALDLVLIVTIPKKKK